MFIDLESEHDCIYVGICVCCMSLIIDSHLLCQKVSVIEVPFIIIFILQLYFIISILYLYIYNIIIYL